MPRRVARPLPRHLDMDVVRSSFLAFLSNNPASPWDDVNAVQEWATSITRIQGFELSYLTTFLRRIVTEEIKKDETELETVLRVLDVEYVVHADGKISRWAGLMSTIMFDMPELVITILRWRQTAPKLEDLPPPRRRPDMTKFRQAQSAN